MIGLIGTLPWTLSILMIEHYVKVVFSVADRITVLYYGKVLATGSPPKSRPTLRVREGAPGWNGPMLELENINAYYGDSHILHGVSLSVVEGETACLAATALARPRRSSLSWDTCSRGPAVSATGIATSPGCRPMR